MKKTSKANDVLYILGIQFVHKKTYERFAAVFSNMCPDFVEYMYFWDGQLETK